MISRSLAQSPSSMTLLLNETMGGISSLNVSSVCQMQVTIQMPVNEPTNISLQINTYNSTSNSMMIISKPIVTIGQNYNLTTAPIPQLSSSYGDSRVLHFTYRKYSKTKPMAQKLVN